MADMMGDMEPLMEKKEEPKNDGPQAGEYVEKGTFCYCCTTKCGIITIAILLIIDFCIECFNTYLIFDNDFFDPMYGNVMIAFLVLYFVAVVLLFIYLVANDSPDTRALIPWGFLIGSIANFLIVIWIIVYIGFMYEEDKVYVKSSDTSGMGAGSSDSKSSSSGSAAAAETPEQ